MKKQRSLVSVFKNDATAGILTVPLVMALYFILKQTSLHVETAILLSLLGGSIPMFFFRELIKERAKLKAGQYLVNRIFSYEPDEKFSVAPNVRIYLSHDRFKFRGDAVEDFNDIYTLADSLTITTYQNVQNTRRYVVTEVLGR